MGRKHQVEGLALFDAIAGLDTPPPDAADTAGGDTAPIPLPEPTKPEAAATSTMPRRSKTHRRPPRIPVPALVVAAILTAAATTGLITRPDPAPRPTSPRVARTTTPSVPAAAPTAPATTPAVRRPPRRPPARAKARPVRAKPTPAAPPARRTPTAVTQPHQSVAAGSAAREFAP